jgi:CheY-like chemotaxis protein/two-component sensor histidine kinase
MSHELRTPLNSLLILAQLLSDNKAGNLNTKQIEYAKTIHSAGNDLLTLINEILDLSKVEAGKMEVHLEEIILTELAEMTEHKFHHVAENKKLTFSVNCHENLPPHIYTDGQRLKQILNNLLSNAFKFTTEGSITVEIGRPAAADDFVRKIGLNPQKTIKISVIDSGIGIPQDKLMLVFEAFQQADGTTNRRFGGTGLGLSISRQLARLLGGDVHLRSEVGKGSVFTLYLPEHLEVKSQNSNPSGIRATPRPSAETPQTADEPVIPWAINQVPESVAPPTQSVETTKLYQHPAPPAVPTETEVEDDRFDLQAGDKFILVVEDDRKFSSILMELAREKGFKCILAEDGKVALQLTEQYQPNAIILDVGLPKVDGWTVMERLKDNPKTRHIPVHFMSAADHGRDARNMGAIGYLLKPVSMNELSEAFRRIEQFIAKTLKRLVIVVESQLHQDKILDLVSNEGATVVTLKTCDEAHQYLLQNTTDCLILDIDLTHGTAVKLLKQLAADENLSQIPVIIYADRELTLQEEQMLQACSSSLTVKAVRSPERLLDEATLFLHQLEASLPKEKRKMLQMVHDKEAILRGKKVLVVDDDMRNTFALATVLEEREMEVLVAKNGKESLRLLEENTDISLVLMDIMMPEMDGYEAMRKIRAQPRFRKLPMIALTAKAMKGDKAKCIEAGANDYLAKPVDTDKLVSLMRVWLYR